MKTQIFFGIRKEWKESETAVSSDRQLYPDYLPWIPSYSKYLGTTNAILNHFVTLNLIASHHEVNDQSARSYPNNAAFTGLHEPWPALCSQSSSTPKNLMTPEVAV